MDIFHESLTRQVSSEEMPVIIAAQVTLLARFYERLGDHAVNLARRIELLPSPAPSLDVRSGCLLPRSRPMDSPICSRRIVSPRPWCR